MQFVPYVRVHTENSNLIDRLPLSIRVLLESAIRNCDNFLVDEATVERILNWEETSRQDVEIPFLPARVVMQDFTFRVASFIPYIFTL